MTIRWVAAFVDRTAACSETCFAFWAAVTKSTRSPTRGDNNEFATLIPSSGDAYLRTQVVDDGGGTHLDLHVDDVATSAAIAESLGAHIIFDLGTYRILRWPAGLVFASFHTMASTDVRGRLPSAPEPRWLTRSRSMFRSLLIRQSAHLG